MGHFQKGLVSLEALQAAQQDTVEVVDMARSKKSVRGSKAAKRAVAAVAKEGGLGDTEDGRLLWQRRPGGAARDTADHEEHED